MINTRRDRPIGTLASFNLRLTVAAVLALAGGAILLAYLLLPGHRDGLKFSAAAAFGLTAIYSAFYAGASIRYRNRLETIGRSADLVREVSSFELTKIRMKLERSFDQEKIPPAELYDKILADEETHATVIYMLNKFDYLASLVRLGYVDEEALYVSLNYLLPFWVKTFRPYIDERRHRKGRHSLYTDAEALAAAWNSGHLLSTGKRMPSHD
jgi:hypothetical protein